MANSQEQWLEIVENLTHEISGLRNDVSALKDTIDEIRQLVGPFGVKMRDGSVLTHTIHGQNYFIDPDDVVMAPQMIVYRQWEADLSNLFRRLCRPETVFVDVGANFGYFTCLAAGLIGAAGTGMVHAFEPSPRMFALLQRNVEINWSGAPVKVYQAAVTDSNGQVELHIPRDHAANASLTALASDGAEVVQVPAVRLDDVLPNDAIIHIMKVDVEGHELDVLNGASATIKRNSDIRLILEWSQKQMQEAEISPESMRNFAVEHALQPHLVDIAGDERAVEWTTLLNQQYANIVLKRNVIE